MIDINHLLFILFLGLSLGIILMVAIYNGIHYYFHKEKAFLYYALMQVGLIFILLYDTGIIRALVPTQDSESYIYQFISLFTFFCIIMFARTFLQTSLYLPTHDRILKYLLGLLLIDALVYPLSFIFDLGLYLFIFPYIVYIGYKRMKQKYYPAKLFFIGEGLFTLSILIDGFTEIKLHIDPFIFNPMLIGIVIEAITLAIALVYQFKEMRVEKQKQKQLLIHQSKLASMGEMLGNIAHQWRQPLMRLSYTLMNIEYTSDQKERTDLVLEGTEQLEYMSQTINDFTEFYAPSKEKESFSLTQESQHILDFIHTKEVEILLEVIQDSTIYTYKNEFKQVLLNLLSNAKEILEERKIPNPKIILKITEDSISIEDNAGGIHLENIEKIFEPYFSTKEKGLGIGLYMSKMIIEKNMGGTLHVKNTKEGAQFKISFG